MQFSSWRTALLSLILPATCAACDQLCEQEAPFCPPCEATLEPILHGCPRCALPLVTSDARALAAGTAPSCLACLRDPPPWEAAWSGFVFGGALAVAMRRWKLASRPELSRGLASLLTRSLAQLPESIDALVPVPLHPRRLRAREFNQAGLMARLARSPRRFPVREFLERVRDTPPQARLERAARQRNVQDAFRALPRAGVRGAHLCLVDDILTTGATLAACTRALLAAGAARVDVLTLARALP